MGSRVAALVAAAVDLVLPVACAGCDAPATPAGVCGECAGGWRVAPRETRPTPAPAGLPVCVSGGEYGGVLRSVILAYKEHGRRGLAGRLGDALADVVAAGAGGRAGAWPLVLIPVPGTSASIRARHGDHMLRLATRAARRLRNDGWPVALARPLRARPKADSAHLDRADRALAAQDAFALRPGRASRLRADAADAIVVVLDDVLTTGATVAAVSRRLLEAGVPVSFAATVAATRLRGADLGVDRTAEAARRRADRQNLLG